MSKLHASRTTPPLPTHTSLLVGRQAVHAAPPPTALLACVRAPPPPAVRVQLPSVAIAFIVIGSLAAVAALAFVVVKLTSKLLRTDQWSVLPQVPCWHRGWLLVHRQASACGTQTAVHRQRYTDSVGLQYTYGRRPVSQCTSLAGAARRRRRRWLCSWLGCIDIDTLVAWAGRAVHCSQRLEHCHPW